jgi:hypothetical protein
MPRQHEFTDDAILQVISAKITGFGRHSINPGRDA